jgi:hypothetical protein
VVEKEKGGNCVLGEEVNDGKSGNRGRNNDTGQRGREGMHGATYLVKEDSTPPGRLTRNQR